jgi:hypothetical protein
MVKPPLGFVVAIVDRGIAADTGIAIAGAAHFVKADHLPFREGIGGTAGAQRSQHDGSSEKQGTMQHEYLPLATTAPRVDEMLPD